MVGLAHNLIWASVMVGLTTVMHLAGITGLIAMLRAGRDRAGPRPPVWRQFAALLFVVFCLFGLHTIEVWSYGAFYMAVGAFDTFEEALYFSTSTFTTVGFGDVVLGPDWRLFSAIESANGFLLIGWSTAFLVAVTARLRIVEAEMEGD